MSEKASGFDAMAVFKDAMKIPIIDETLSGNAKNQTFLYSQLVAALGSSADFTPTFTPGTNMEADAPADNKARYTKIGNVVTVFGYIDPLATSSGNADFVLTLPVLTTVLVEEDLAGIVTVQRATVFSVAGYCEGENTATKKCRIEFQAQSNAIHKLRYSYSYTIV